MKNKGFVHILVLILVVTIIGIASWVSWTNEYIRNKDATVDPFSKVEVANTPTITPTPTTDPNPQPISNPFEKNWKTYTNNKYSYSFKYPLSDELERYNTYTDELIVIKGLDFEVIRIEPVDTSETDPLTWWKTQKTEVFTQFPVWCFSQKNETKIRSLYNNNELVVEFKVPVLVLNAFYSDEPMCHDGTEAQIILIPHKGRIIKVTHNYATISEQILSTFKLID